MQASASAAQPPVVVLRVPAFMDMGWAETDASLAPVLRALRSRGWAVEVWTVEERAALMSRLATAPPALYWPDAYWIGDGPARAPVSLPGVLEAAGVPFIGSPAAALAAMEDKAACQARLDAAGVPIPARRVVEGPVGAEELAEELAEVGLVGPLIVKPARLSGSRGIDGDSVCRDPVTAARRATAAAARYGSVLVEQFLPGDDLTVAVVGEGAARRVMATWYRVDGCSGGARPLDRAARLLPWGGNKRMDPVRDPGLLAQVEALCPRVWAAVGARDVIRFDARTDGEGRLRVFDVNGMPALAWPDGVLIRQLLVTRCDGAESFDVFADFIGEIVGGAAGRVGRSGC